MPKKIKKNKQTKNRNTKNPMKLHRLKAMLLNYYYFSKTSPDRIFDIIYWPVLEILIWGFVMVFVQGISQVNLLNAVLGGIILWVFVWRSNQDVVVYLMEFYWSRSIYHFFASPLTATELMVSLCILGLLRALLSFTLLSILSYFLYAFNVLSINVFHALFFITLLLLFGWSLGLMVSSLVLRYGSKVQVLAWSTIWIIQPFSCVFYPLSALPSWAQHIARWLPTTHVFEGLRASLAGQPLAWTHLWYAFAMTLLLLLLASLLVRSALLAGRKQGTFAKPE